MKARVMAIVAFSLLPAGGQAAETSQEALAAMAEAMAYERVCDDVTVNAATFRALAAAHDLQAGKGTADNRIVTTLAQGALVKLLSSDNDDYCKAALALYGPDGTSEPDLLKTK